MSQSDHVGAKLCRDLTAGFRFKKADAHPSFPELEEAVLLRWKREDVFQESLRRTSDGPEFIFYDGPPFPTGAPHHGTIFVSILKDVIPRYKTMRGFHVPRVWGWDCHGLPIETAAEKSLGIKDKSQIYEIGVEKFNAECRRLVSTYNDAWRLYIDRIGRWVDMDHPYRTLDRDFMESVIWAFTEAHKKGLIYKDYRVSPYCYRCETPLSISETRLDDSTRPKQDRSVTVKLRVLGQPETYFLVWTTTPWTLPANLAIAVGPNVSYVFAKSGGETYILAESCLGRYTNEFKSGVTVERTLGGTDLVAEGLSYAPLFSYFANRNPNGFRPIVGEFVTTDEGTGIVHCAPAFGEDDYWACRRHGIGVINPVDEKGCFTSEVVDFAGRNVHEANADIVRYVRGVGSLVRDMTFEHNYPHCWRCRTPLIYRALDAWYLKVEDMRNQLLANNDEIGWHPETAGKGRFGNWIANARDWNISRSRFWATPIPVWECDRCDRVESLGSVAEIEGKWGNPVHDLHKEHLDQVTYKCPCGGRMNRVPEVLDCWFESGSMPYGQWHYPFENAAHFRSHFPADFIVEYTGQIRGWFYVLHVLSTALFGKPAFSHCLVHGTLLAADGKKMSKSLKNYTDPLELVNRHGADALRAYLLSSNAVQMVDLNFRDQGVEEMIRRLSLPLWNALSFFTTYAEIDGVTVEDLEFGKHATAMNELDRYAISEVELLVAVVTKRLDEYDIQAAMRAFPEFLDTLNNWYIRRSRKRAWDAGVRSPEKMAFYATTHRLLSRLCQVLAPLCPFLAESVWAQLGYRESVHLSNWPEPAREWIDEGLSVELAAVRQIISAGLAIRAREKIRVRQPLARALIGLSKPVNLTPHWDAILQELNVKELTLVRDPREIAERVGKPNARILGPKYGRRVQEIIKLVKDGKFVVNADGTATVGEFVLGPTEMEVHLVGRDGLAVEAIGGNVVALDLHITPELDLEGRARDLVRQIQELRKEAGLNISNRIILGIRGAEEIVRVHGNYIRQETLSIEIVTSIENAIISKSTDIGGASVGVSLRKV